MKNIAIVHNIIAPYRMELFERLAQLSCFRLTVLFCAQTETNRHWKVPKELRFRHCVLRGIHLHTNRSDIHFNPALWTELSNFRPDLIVSSGFSLPTLITLAYAYAHRIPLVVWLGGTLLSEKSISSAKKAFRKFIVQRSQGFLVYGLETRDYLISLGAPDDRIWIAGNATFDVKQYHSKSLTFRVKKSKICKERRLPPNLILAVGQLIERKNYELLIRAFHSIHDQFPDWGLIVVGTGPLYRVLRNRCSELGLDSVFLVGHVEPEELPVYYGISDLFVHPTKLDQWSQVINEAMASALPVITTDRCGVRELIRDGQTGFIIEPRKKMLQDRMVSLLSSTERRRVIGLTAFETIKRWDVGHTLKAFKTAIYQAIGTRCNTYVKEGILQVARGEGYKCSFCYQKNSLRHRIFNNLKK